MSKLFSQNKYVLFLLLGIFTFFFCLSFFAESTFDAGDGIRHYLISRYSWQHADLLLYSWGKPFFTIISSPFSQLGLLGMNVFNILCGIGSSYFAYKIAQTLKLDYALLVIPFLLFAPCYFPTLNSGLTEPFFGFILIFSIYLMFIERFFFACILVSFLPFVRTEGNMILPLFFIVLIFRRKFLLIPMLAFGTFVYSVVGYFYFDDFFWVVNQNPYNGDNKSFYGNGELLHFIDNYNFIWGSTLAILFVVGIIAIVFKSSSIIKIKGLKDSKLPEEVILIYGAFVIYFVAHSIMWWKGLANSLGLLRVVAAVIPCSAIICLRGFNVVMIPFFREKKILKYVLIAATLFWIIRDPFKHDYFPYKLTREASLIKEAGEWFKESAYTSQKVYYLYPLLAHVLNVDSFDPNKVGELWGLYPTIKELGIGAVPDSTIIFWDAHFGPNECKIPLDTIMNDQNFDLLKTFYPKERFTTLGGHPFTIRIFEKRNKPKLQGEKLLYELLSINFELPNGMDVLNKETEYGKILEKPISAFPSQTNKLIFNAAYLSEEVNSKDAVVVLAIDSKEGKNVFWAGNSFSFYSDSTNTKNVSVNFSVSLNDFQPTDIVKIFIWNKNKQEFNLKENKISCWGKL